MLNQNLSINLCTALYSLGCYAIPERWTVGRVNVNVIPSFPRLNIYRNYFPAHPLGEPWDEVLVITPLLISVADPEPTF